MQRKILIIALALIVMMACGQPLRGKSTLTPAVPPEQNLVTAKPGTPDGILKSGGVTRHYLLHIPSSYQPSSPASLIISFHGFGINSKEEEILQACLPKRTVKAFSSY